MFGSLGLPEILLILVIALLVFGPKRLPEVGRTIGKGLGEFRRASADLKRTVNAELALDDDERPRSARRPEPPRALAGAPAPNGSAAATGAGAAASPEPASAQPADPEAGNGEAAAADAEPAEPTDPPGSTEPVTTH